MPPLQEVTFSLKAGEAWLISGPNGGGKSTFLKLLRGELSAISGTRRYFLNGRARSSAVQALKALALVSPEQEAFYLQRDWVQSVADVLLSGYSGDTLRLWEAAPEAVARLSEVAEQIQIQHLLERDFRTLSHGQRRRTLLGRALMPRPAALLLDEFTDGLSQAARKELRGVLEGVAATGTAIILVTHRPEEAPQLAWRYAQIAGGRLILDTPPPSAPNPTHRQSPPQPSSKAQPSKPSPANTVLVQLTNAEVYRNGHHALGPISWTWHSGQHWLVTGENGAGKSTLARLVAGEFHPARVDLVGLDPALSGQVGQVVRPFLRRDTLSERQRQIGLLSAEIAIRQRRDWTGLEVMGSAYSGTEGFSAPLTHPQQQQVQALAERLGAGELLSRSAETLSQGQLRRLLLGRSLIHRPKLLILDEGLDFLDALARAEVMMMLVGLMHSGTHLMMVVHRPEDAPLGITHHLELEAGQIKE